MDPSSKRPFWGQNFLLFFAGFSLFSNSFLASFYYYSLDREIKLVEIEPSELEKSVPMLQGNTLIPLADPIEVKNEVKGKLPVIVTAYSSTPWETDQDPYITATGKLVREGIVANNSLKPGTKVRFPEIYGDKIFVVEDRMHYRKDPYHFDIWFPSYWEAKNFGVKNTYVEILD
jgi:3D (Asp-Asp-Asp) domain-containing protein